MRHKKTMKFDDLGDVTCPKCGNRCAFEIEDYPELVSYYGEDSPLEVECGSCDAKFNVFEHVTRYWSVDVEIEIPEPGRQSIVYDPITKTGGRHG